MSKSKSTPGVFAQIGSNPFAISDFGARAQTAWAAQSAALEHVHDFLGGWYARRQAAATSAAECCTLLAGGGGDMSAAAQAWSEWMASEADRLRADVEAQAALAVKLASAAADAYGVADGKPSRRKAHAGHAVDDDGGRVRPAADVR